MLDVYFQRNQSAPDLQLDLHHVANHWEAFQVFQQTTGIAFDFYSDFEISPKQALILIDILENNELLANERKVETVKFHLLLWKCVALKKTLFFVGD